MMNGPSGGDLVKCGARVFSDSTTKWPGLRLSSAPRLLASTLEKPSMEDWWKGNDKLPLGVAAKAVNSLMGVEDGTDAPTGHPRAAFEWPLVHLCKARLLQIGNKLAATTKETIDIDSDWLSPKADMSAVAAHLPTRVGVEFRGIKFGEAKDWVVVDGDSYSQATLVSVDADIDTRITRAFECLNDPPLFDNAFHFDADEEVPDIPRTAPASASGSSGFASPARAGDCVTPLKSGLKRPGLG